MARLSAESGQACHVLRITGRARLHAKGRDEPQSFGVGRCPDDDDPAAGGFRDLPARTPIAPAPVTTTVSPGPTTPSPIALHTHASGSASAAAWSSMDAGMRCRFRAGTTTYGAKPPSTPDPIDSRAAHSIGRPSRHQRHAPQLEKIVSSATSAPTQPEVDVRRDGIDAAGHLVAHRHRRVEPVLVAHQVDVGATDAGRGDGDPNLSRTGLGDRDLDESGFAGTRDELADGEHQWSLAVQNGPRRAAAGRRPLAWCFGPISVTGPSVNTA